MSFSVYLDVADALTLVPHASDMAVAATTDTSRATLKARSVMTTKLEAVVPLDNAMERRFYRRCIAKGVKAEVFTLVSPRSVNSLEI